MIPLLLLACASTAPTGIIASFQTAGSTSGTIYDATGECAAETSTGTDLTGCCPPDAVLIGSDSAGAVCAVSGYTALVTLVAPAVDGVVDLAAACWVPDRLEPKKVDYAACCPEGTEFVGISRGGFVCGVR